MRWVSISSFVVVADSCHSNLYHSWPGLLHLYTQDAAVTKQAILDLLLLIFQSATPIKNQIPSLDSVRAADGTVSAGARTPSGAQEAERKIATALGVSLHKVHPIEEQCTGVIWEQAALQCRTPTATLSIWELNSYRGAVPRCQTQVQSWPCVFVWVGVCARVGMCVCMWGCACVLHTFLALVHPHPKMCGVDGEGSDVISGHSSPIC